MMNYEPARGSEVTVCWVLIVGCGLIITVIMVGWLAAAMEFSYPEVVVPMLVIVSAIARLRGWAPTPKGGAGGGGGP